jgi:hypothetical protein
MLSKRKLLDLLTLVRVQVSRALGGDTQSSRGEQVPAESVSMPSEDAFERFMGEFTRRSRESSARPPK